MNKPIRILLMFAAMLAVALAARAQQVPTDKAKINPGDPATFTVTVSGSLPMTFQWFKNGLPIQGAIANPYRIAVATPADAGVYTVRVTNSDGFTVSTPATLTVTNPPVVTGIAVEKK